MPMGLEFQQECCLAIGDSGAEVRNLPNRKFMSCRTAVAPAHQLADFSPKGIGKR